MRNRSFGPEQQGTTAESPDRPSKTVRHRGEKFNRRGDRIASAQAAAEELLSPFSPPEDLRNDPEFMAACVAAAVASRSRTKSGHPNAAAVSPEAAAQSDEVSLPSADARGKHAALRESDAQQMATAHRQSMMEIEARRKAAAAELREAKEREATYRLEINDLRNAKAELTAQRDADASNFQNADARREMQENSLRWSLHERNAELEELRQIMAQRAADAEKLTEDLRLSLLHTEAKRAADAEEFLAIVGRREALSISPASQDQTRT